MQAQTVLFPELERHQSRCKGDEFTPTVIGEAPAEIRDLPSGTIDEKIAKAKAILKWVMGRHQTAFSTSFGKDSSSTVGLAMSAAAELVRDGLEVKPFVILTANTGVENPVIESLAQQEMRKIEDWIDRHQLPGSMHVASPNLASSFAVSIIGGRAIPSMQGHKRDCSVDWKVEPLNRLRKALLGNNNLPAGEFTVSVTGVRASESAVRARNLKKRAESDVDLVVTNENGNVALAPILSWDYLDVFEYLGMCANGLITTYSDMSDVVRIYREASGECMILGSDQTGPSNSCSSRFGCWNCLAVKDDKSMDTMVLEPHNAFMEPLARFRRFLSHSFHDQSRRTWVGRTIDANGYIRFGVDGYNPSMLQDLLKYALSIDADEQIASRRLGIAPRFRIVSLEALLAIEASWSMQAFAPAWSALKIYRDIRRGARYPVPDIPDSPKQPIPPPRFIYVGDAWDQAQGWQYTGLRDPLAEVFGGDGCMGNKVIVSNGVPTTVLDVNTADLFSVDAESAYLFMEFELDRLVDEWHGPNARRGLLMEGHHASGISYRFLLQYGTISVAKGQIGRIDAILRRSAFRERMGLAGYNYDHDRALSMSVPESVPVIPSQAEVKARHDADIASMREYKRGLVRNRRINIVQLYSDWAPDVPWRQLVRTKSLRMVGLPRSRQGSLVLRHLITPYNLLAFLCANPSILQKVIRHRQAKHAHYDLFRMAA